MNHSTGMMNPTVSVVIMIIASIVITYYLSMTIILRTNKTNNLNKIYQSILMGLWMGLVELAMFGILTNFMSWNILYTVMTTVLILGIATFTYLIYAQVGIKDNKRQFSLSMIEHHQMAIDMATLAKQSKLGSTDPTFTQLLDNILTDQEKEIAYMKTQL